MSHRKIAILVAGMHRSGTSAQSRLLNLVGCDLPKTLMEPSPENNETGFWESQPISDLNRNILLSRGSNWNEWRTFDSGWYASPKVVSFREEAQALLHQEFGDSRLFVLKDPRLCLLLPFWIEVLETFGAEPRIVLPIRNPLDVAMSLKRRDGIDASNAYLIWLRHVLEAESGSRNLRRAYLRYDTLLSEPHAAMDRLGRDLDVSWPKRASVRAHAEIERFLSPELRHHQSDDAAFLTDPVLSRWLGQCFELFNRWSRGEVCETDVALLDRIRSAFDEATPLFSRYVAGYEQAVAERDRRIEGLSEAVAERDRRIEGLSEAVAERDGRIEGLSEAVAERDGRIEGLSEAVAERDGRIEGLSEAVAERDGRIEGLSEAVAERDGRIEGLSEAVAERDGRIEGLSEAVAERDGRIEGLSEAVAERDGRIEGLSEAVAERDGRIEALRDVVVALNGRTELLTRNIDSHRLTIEALLGSSSWRITAPLRLVREIARLVLARGRADSSRIARTVYLRMPLPYSLKIRIKGILFRSIPFLFRHTAAYRDWSAISSVRDRLATPRASRPTLDAGGSGAERRRSGCSTETGAARNRSVAARVADLNSRFTKTSDVCIVFHVYYEDVAERIVSEFLEPVLGDIDVFVTTHDTISMKMLDYLEERLPGLYVMLCENRGRDIRPFLQVLPLVLENGYEIACKIHTKKSAHRSDSSEWGIRLLESLLNFPGDIQEIVRTFSRNERLGLVVPPYSPLWLGNPCFHQDDRFWLNNLLIRMGEAGQIDRYEFVFPAGSMFWFRVRALSELANREFIGLNQFESETGQLGGALQHSIERIIILLAEKSGFDWMIGPHRPNIPDGGVAAASRGASPAHLERLRPFAMQGQLTKGWYAGRELRPEETMVGGAARPPRVIRRLAKQAYENGTRQIQTRYLPGGETENDEDDLAQLALRYGPIDEIRTFLASREPPGSAVEMADCGGFTIMTPFHRHLDLFRKTAESVSRLSREENTAGSALEWVIVNDDPIVSNDELARRIPERLRRATRQIRPDGNGGIVDALNTGIRHSRHRWTLFLDCDDEIEQNAITVLKHYIERFPRCRYISSSMVDIDEQGNTLRFRGNEFSIDRLADIGMMAGHLKAIRCDLFEDVGYLDPYFESCQDYEFALRTAMQEPIMKIPDPLYRYRWHARTQSVSRAGRQKIGHQRIQRKYLRRFLSLQEGRERDAAAKVRPCSPQPRQLRGAAIVRTQNRRPELLAEAVESVRIQSRLTPVVIVHGSEDDLRAVEDQLSGRGSTDVLLASEDLKPGRRLGYPANVALDYVSGRSDRFDYLCFLDDDDIFYPCFASRMSDALAWSGADIVYGMSNKRFPWQAIEAGHMPLPSSCLVAENFITCNSYVLSTEFVRHCDVRFDEHLHYFDDWDFLLTLWGAGARFQFIAETVSEYRIYGDGQLSAVDKRYPKLNKKNFSQVKDKARKIAYATEDGLTRFQRDLLDFDWAESRRPRWTDSIVRTAHEIWAEARQRREERPGGRGR